MIKIYVHRYCWQVSFRFAKGELSKRKRWLMGLFFSYFPFWIFIWKSISLHLTNLLSDTPFSISYNYLWWELSNPPFVLGMVLLSPQILCLKSEEKDVRMRLAFGLYLECFFSLVPMNWNSGMRFLIGALTDAGFTYLFRSFILTVAILLWNTQYSVFSSSLTFFIFYFIFILNFR